jgi:hypothetical protein
LLFYLGTLNFIKPDRISLIEKKDHNSMKASACFLLTLIGLLSCQSSNPTGLNRDQQRLVLVYVDLLYIQQNVSPAHPAYGDSCRTVMKKYGISESLYSDIVQSLNRQPEKWEAFYQAVLNEMDTRNQQPIRQNDG